jgi:anti-sigma regulatory factor (Ser/Thr protein kinase)
VALARRELRRLGASLATDRLGDLELVVTELVTNALVHGRGAVRLELALTPFGVGGHVLDDGPGFAYEPHASAPEEPDGRGLRIVDALTTRWGVEPGRALVWFEVDVAAGPAPSRVSAGDARP